MSGIDERKIECPFCSTKEGYRNTHNIEFMTPRYKGARTTSREEDRMYGSRIILHIMDVENDVITSIKCSKCGNSLDARLRMRGKAYFRNMLKKGKVIEGHEWEKHKISFLPECTVCNDGKVGHCACTRDICTDCGLHFPDCECGVEEDEY